ncbi:MULTISPECIES: hypothetical protein [unclassified Bradyrhizobium]|uniref:hypothetical protein n=1 Tax=unclassified Bradyrhizobium TaxID=2631580 RepID=UPI00291638C2|nr:MULTISPECIES: hypothetical protein [unclassified Bradyrhizobium]
MTTQRIKLLEKSARAALDSALAARNRLADAVEASGEVHVPMFLTGEEHRKIVRRMRADHKQKRAELVQVLTTVAAIFADPNSAHSEFHGFAKMMWAAMQKRVAEEALERREAFYVVQCEPEDEQAPAAEQIVRAGRKRRGEE